MKLLAKVLTILGFVAATTGTSACASFLIDEPKMPKSLLNK